MKNPIVIYHWWGEEQPIYSNLSHPVLLSIATLRAVNPTIEIQILNYSKHDEPDWAHFQKKFDFKIFESKFYLENNYKHIVGYELLSRIFDIRQHVKSPILYCDSDVFWLRDPLPLACDINKFCFDGYNSGFFYCDYNSPKVKEMLNVFESYTITAFYDKQFCQTIKDKTNYDAWPYIWDETILSYMNQTGLHDMFNIVPLEEHGAARSMNFIKTEQLKMLHCNGLMIKNPKAKRQSELNHSRGLACLLFKEFYDNICKVLDESELKMIFTDREIEDCLSQQVSLFDIEKMQKMKRADGNYEFIVRSAQSQWLI